jgi:integrase
MRKLWVIPGYKKGCKRKVKEKNEPHYVPLSWQAMKVLERLKELSGDSPYLFPSQFVAGHPISDAAFGNLLKQLGYKNLHTPHGFRASAMTIMLEELEIKEKVIESQLGHVTSNKNGTSYDRAEYIRKRRIVMQQWADFLDRIVVDVDQKQEVA